LTKINIQWQLIPGLQRAVTSLMGVLFFGNTGKPSAEQLAPIESEEWNEYLTETVRQIDA